MNVKILYSTLIATGFLFAANAARAENPPRPATEKAQARPDAKGPADSRNERPAPAQSKKPQPSTAGTSPDNVKKAPDADIGLGCAKED